jgi:hypothetical protein
MLRKRGVGVWGAAFYSVECVEEHFQEGFRCTADPSASLGMLGNKLFALYQGTTSVRAILGQNGQGFSPYHRKIGAEIPRERGTGAKAQLFFAPLRHD